MNKKTVISVVVTFILCMGLGFFVHGVLLKPDYAQLANLFRTEQDAQNYFPFMLIAHVIFAIGFVWVYVKGKEDKPFLMQGIRFGIAVALLTAIPMYLIFYAVQPMPEATVCKQIVFDTLGTIFMGIIVAWLNK